MPRKISKPKKKISSFLVTINCNKTQKTYLKKLKDGYNIVYENIEKFIKGVEPNFSLDKIESIESLQTNLGIGSKYHKAHLHSFIKIEHNTKIQLDQNKLRKFFNNYLFPHSDDKVHLNIKFIKLNNINDVMEYVKNQKLE